MRLAKCRRCNQVKNSAEFLHRGRTCAACRALAAEPPAPSVPCRGHCRYSVPCRRFTLNANRLCHDHQHQADLLDRMEAFDAAQCPVCHGRGSVPIVVVGGAYPNPDDKTVQCGACRGSGLRTPEAMEPEADQ